MTITICDGPTDNVVKPAPYYSEIAAACRAMGMDIADDDYEKSTLSVKATQCG